MTSTSDDVTANLRHLTDRDRRRVNALHAARAVVGTKGGGVFDGPGEAKATNLLVVADWILRKGAWYEGEDEGSTVQADESLDLVGEHPDPVPDEAVIVEPDDDYHEKLHGHVRPGRTYEPVTDVHLPDHGSS